MLSLAYPLIVMALTDSPVQAAWAAIALTIPGLLCYLPAGVLADRVDPRSLMVVAETLRAAAVVSVVAALLLDMATVPHLLVAAALEGTLFVLYSLAENALIPFATKSDTGLRRALAKSESSSHLAVMTGRSLGGFFYGLGQAIPFVMNSLLLAVSLTSILRMQVQRSRARHAIAPRNPFRAVAAGLRELSRAMAAGLRELRPAMADGLQELRRHRFLRQAVPIIAVTNVVVNALIVIFIATSNDLSAWKVGLVLAAGGIGGFLGAWAFLPLASRLASSPERILAIQVWVWVVAFAIATFGPRPVNFGLATFLTGFVGAMSNNIIRAFEAEHVDRAKIARVTSISRLVGRSATALAAPIGGMLIATMSTESAIRLLLAVTALLAGTATIWRAVENTSAWTRGRAWTGRALEVTAWVVILMVRVARAATAPVWRAVENTITWWRRGRAWARHILNATARAAISGD